MMLGSLYAGLALSNTGTAAAHALAYPIGGLVKSPHGEVTGLLLPYVMEYNAAVAEEKMIHISKAFRVDVSNMDRKEASLDRKSTRLNSSHVAISYAVFCLKKKKKN